MNTVQFNSVKIHFNPVQVRFCLSMCELWEKEREAWRVTVKDIMLTVKQRKESLKF